MKSKLKLYLAVLGILILAASAFWIVWPKGSSINLNKIGIHYSQKFPVRLGLDLQGGSHLVYQANFKDIPDTDRANALAAIRDTLERRVNSFGVSEPSVQIEGGDKIIIELPGIKDVNEAIKQIGQTPFLEFKTQNPTPQATMGPDGKLVVDADSQWISTGLSGKQLARATADIQAQGSGSVGQQVIVRLEFNSEGKDLFAKITQDNIGKPVAIFLDGQLLSQPTVQTAITDGVAIISGNYTIKDAKELATRLNSGALPVPIHLVSQQNVGATLGQESIKNSLIAGLIGILLIALFMLVNYRFPGALAVVALIIYALVAFAIFKIGISITAVILVGLFFLLGLTVSGWFGLLALISYIVLLLLKGLSPVTITLAGIAGFILSIGMAVDANILIFERFKEEIHNGKGIEQAINDGFTRAWNSIRDSNVSSLITTLILYIFGTPAIRGFAVTLGVGILVSMFTAITITRTLLKVFVGNNILLHPWLFGARKRKIEQAPEVLN